MNDGVSFGRGTKIIRESSRGRREPRRRRFRLLRIQRPECPKTHGAPPRVYDLFVITAGDNKVRKISERVDVETSRGLASGGGILIPDWHAWGENAKIRRSING